MNGEFIDRIAYPDTPAMQNIFTQAAEDVKETLHKNGWSDINSEIIRYLSFTYYHDWHKDDPDYLFVLQDPGTLYERHLRNFSGFLESREEPELRDMISLNRRFSKSFLRRNEDFTRQFINMCDTYDLINVKNWNDYITENRFFDDFYHTNIIRYRYEDHKMTDRAVSYHEYLLDEINYVNPKIVFVFGGDAWATIHSEMELTPTRSADESLSNVTDSHGRVFRTTDPIETLVIPLVHPSGRSFNMAIRNSYFDYLDEGLRTYHKGCR